MSYDTSYRGSYTWRGGPIAPAANSTRETRSMVWDSKWHGEVYYHSDSAVKVCMAREDSSESQTAELDVTS